MDESTDYLFAPMEGITIAGYRQVHHDLFGGVTEYYTPFIAPDSRGSFKAKYLKELTEDSGKLRVIPQLLVNNAEPFCLTAEKLKDLGFQEINLNIGCPSGTVYAKHKGAGMLTDLSSLERILGQIFAHAEKNGYRVSIKTRMGVHSTSEFQEILRIYRRYPVSRLIVHARSRDMFYRGDADLEGFAEMTRECPSPLCYNGDIASKTDLQRLNEMAPEVHSVMIGRAAVANPALFRYLKGGSQLACEELREFHDRLLKRWLEEGLSPAFTVERMKTIWAYMQALFPDNRREVKVLMKSRTLESYSHAADVLLREGDFRPEQISVTGNSGSDEY